MERNGSERKITVLDAMHFIAGSWNAVSQSTIANSFKHCGFKRETASSAGDATTSMPLEADAGFADDDFEGLNLATTFAEYVEADDNVAIYGEVSLDDAIADVWLVPTPLRHRTRTMTTPQMPCLCLPRSPRCYGT
ncbi:hypothetical protein V5799_004693 [Amblyomma americanum]|uniref:DDE-1 domain-containing protein n=1 Tax=Amblyomma americanum TaxID=6943 RepID=A0AAQ4D5D9_AMBAM